MKKAFIAAAAITVMGSLVCQADVNITWNGLGTNPVLDESGGSAPNTFWAQLIWSADDVASAVDPGAPLMPTDGETVLQEQALNGFNLPGHRWTWCDSGGG